MGLFITLELPTREMTLEADTAGFYRPLHEKKSACPKIQILTVEDLLNGASPQMPRSSGTFREATPAKSEGGDQLDLL
jgi:site-specific DNA-methyltransferase (adenine-specific)